MLVLDMDIEPQVQPSRFPTSNLLPPTSPPIAHLLPLTCRMLDTWAVRASDPQDHQPAAVKEADPLLHCHVADAGPQARLRVPN